MSQQSKKTSTPLPHEKGFWRQLHYSMLLALQDGSFMRFNGYTVPNRTFQYRSLAEFKTLLTFVEEKANLEEGIQPFKGRTHAGMGGRR